MEKQTFDNSDLRRPKNIESFLLSLNTAAPKNLLITKHHQLLFKNINWDKDVFVKDYWGCYFAISQNSKRPYGNSCGFLSDMLNDRFSDLFENENTRKKLLTYWRLEWHFDYECEEKIFNPVLNQILAQLCKLHFEMSIVLEIAMQTAFCGGLIVGATYSKEKSGNWIIVANPENTL